MMHNRHLMRAAVFAVILALGLVLYVTMASTAARVNEAEARTVISPN